jgi:hypothetical protein
MFVYYLWISQGYPAVLEGFAISSVLVYRQNARKPSAAPDNWTTKLLLVIKDVV